MRMAMIVWDWFTKLQTIWTVAIKVSKTDERIQTAKSVCVCTYPKKIL